MQPRFDREKFDVAGLTGREIGSSAQSIAWSGDSFLPPASDPPAVPRLNARAIRGLDAAVRGCGGRRRGGRGFACGSAHRIEGRRCSEPSCRLCAAFHAELLLRLDRLAVPFDQQFVRYDDRWAKAIVSLSKSATSRRSGGPKPTSGLRATRTARRRSPRSRRACPWETRKRRRGPAAAPRRPPKGCRATT